MAKDRCTNPNTQQYRDYGGRGLEFGFCTGTEMAAWVLCFIGLPPTPEHTSIDRIDNNLGYVRGNLRWATPLMQAQNKRKYKRWVYTDGRLERLLEARPDFCYESLRTFINQGLSDADILKRKKTTSGRPRLRHR